MKLKKEELVVERATVMMDVVQLQTQKQISNEGKLIMRSCPLFNSFNYAHND